MDIVASALAYLGSIIGLVVGLPVLGYIFFATPHSPTSPRDPAAMTQNGPMRHKIALLRRSKMSIHREFSSVRRADHMNNVDHAHFAVEGVPAKRGQKSGGLVSGDRENEMGLSQRIHWVLAPRERCPTAFRRSPQCLVKIYDRGDDANLSDQIVWPSEDRTTGQL
jgi:hypothetical protein